MTPDRAVREYCHRGWHVVPDPPNLKRPILKEWNITVFTPRDFAENDNVGVVLGERSGWLVDVDLDCTEALELADIYLPATGAEFGRASTPRSHRLYVAPEAK